VAQFPLYRHLAPKDILCDPKLCSPQAQRKLVNSHNSTSKLTLFQSLDPIHKIFWNRATELEFTNIWINITKNKSLLHFDLYDNYLYMLQGKKTVYLLPPDSKLTEDKSIFEDGFHQVSLNLPKDLTSAKAMGLRRKIAKQKFYGEKLRCGEVIKVVIGRGEVLRIPEGWYHYVISEPNTVALNFWWTSIFDRYDRLGGVVRKKLVLGRTDAFMGKEVFLANHMSKGSSKIFFGYNYRQGFGAVGERA
jgi:hypothetical protein